MSDFVSPLDNPDAYDVAIIAGMRTPGQVTITGAGSPRKWDKKDGTGTSGATIVYGGDELASWDMKIELWTREHFAAWPAFKALIDKPPVGTKPTAKDIYHPYLDDLGIKSFVVEDRSQLELSDGTGVWSTTVKCLQYRAPTPAIGKPTGSKAGDEGKEPTPQDEEDRMILQLEAEREKVWAA